LVKPRFTLVVHGLLCCVAQKGANVRRGNRPTAEEGDLKMKTFVSFAAVAASALFATSALAADLHAAPEVASVRIPVAGKSVAQLKTEIAAAAAAVCGAEQRFCVEDAIADADGQLALLDRSPAHVATQAVEVSKDEPLSRRVAVAGKTRAQILREIGDAARAVCAPLIGSSLDHTACVGQAESEARAQLDHAHVAAAGVEQLALN
jgi:hypothetical protein